MIKWLIKDIREFRLETIEDVKAFEQEQRDLAAENGYIVSNFAYTYKEVKAKGEVVDEYWVVKITCVFNVAKEPENPWNDVEYKKVEAADLEWE